MRFWNNVHSLRFSSVRCSLMPALFPVARGKGKFHVSIKIFLSEGIFEIWMLAGLERLKVYRCPKYGTDADSYRSPSISVSYNART